MRYLFVLLGSVLSSSSYSYWLSKSRMKKEMTTRFPLTQGEQSYLQIQWDSSLHNLLKKSKGKKKENCVKKDFLKAS